MTESILQEADRIINGARRDDYGPAKESFIDIAGRWTLELGSKLNEPLDSYDVVHLMVQLKLSRAKNGYHRDSYVDIGGYVGLTEKFGAAPEAAADEIVWFDGLDEIPKGIPAWDKDSFEQGESDYWHTWEGEGPGGSSYASYGPFTMTYPTKKPRVWEDYAEIPLGVKVTDKDGDVYLRDTRTGLWTFVAEDGDVDVSSIYEPNRYAPFTEVVS